MGDTVNNEEVQKKSFFGGLQSEFKKIIWPDKNTVRKQTIAVLSASIALGIGIGVLDLLIQFVFSLILK